MNVEQLGLVIFGSRVRDWEDKEPSGRLAFATRYVDLNGSRLKAPGKIFPGSKKKMGVKRDG